VTHEEIAVGGCDILSAYLAALLAQSPLFGTDIRLFLMTDVNGVYKDKDKPETRIPVIEDTSKYQSSAKGPSSPHTAGGMAAKFDAANIAKKAGVDTWIFNPSLGDKAAAVRGEIGTYFPAT